LERKKGLLVLDTQGNEGSILKSLRSWDRFNHVIVEVANFESYQSCIQFEEVLSFMANNGFALEKEKIKSRSNVGKYSDLLFAENDNRK
jgi:hypothetical protein